MLRGSVRWLSKRTPGYVFWRQRSLTELEHSRRNYLLCERPVSLGEIARRMARVKARYEDTHDFHERNLLRGEYKYFTGKLCDLRAARLGDMIVLLQCAAFFGFWDAAQVDKILAELFLQLESLEAIEMVALFACMPQLRRQDSELYRRVAAELTSVVGELTTMECLDVCRACTAETPTALTRAVVSELLRPQQWEALTPSQCVEVLDTWSVTPDAMRRPLQEAMELMQQRALDHVESLECMDIAVLYTSLQADAAATARGMSEAVQQRLVHAFTRDLTKTCPRSTAMLFSAVRASHSLSLELAQRMADRVLFLSTDFTPAELLAVLQVYLEGLVSVCVLSAELHAAGTLLPLSTGTREEGRTPSLPLDGNGVPALSDTAVVHTDVAPPPSVVSAVAARQRRLELEFASRSLAALQRVNAGLSEQLVVQLESAAAYLSAESQMEIVELYAGAVEQLEVASSPGESPHLNPEDSSKKKERGAVGPTFAATAQLLRLLPQARRVLQLVSGKLIANMKHASFVQLIELLTQANSLGNAALQDAVVTAAVQELLRRDMKGLTTASALALEQRLRSLTQLRAEHQRRLSSAFIPKVRHYI